MKRKLFGAVVALATAISLAGVAFASIGVEPTQTTTGDSLASSEVSAPDPSTASTEATLVVQSETTATTADGGTTSTTVDDENTTSTTLDDDSGDEHDDRFESHDDSREEANDTDDDHEDDEIDEVEESFDASSVTYEIPDVGSVSVRLQSTRLELVEVIAPGWDYVVKEESDDVIEIEFDNGSARAEFEAEVENGKIEIEVETKS